MTDSNAIKDIEKGIKNILYKISATTCNKVQCYQSRPRLALNVCSKLTMASTKKFDMLGKASMESYKMFT